MAYIIKDDINHEDWMSCLPEKLWDVPLTHLSIPGEPPRKLSDYKSNCDLKKVVNSLLTFVLRILNLHLTILNSFVEFCVYISC